LIKSAGHADEMVMCGSVLEANFRLELTERLPVLSVSDGVEALLGYKAEDFLTSVVSLKERIHKDDSKIAERLFSPEDKIQSGDFNIRIRHSDGRIRCLKGHFTKETRAGGEAVLDLLLQDVTSLWRSRGEQMLSPSFRAMLENTEDYIFFKDSNFVTTGVSMSLEKSPVFPLEHGETVVGLTDYDTYAEGSADAFYRCDQQILSGIATTHIVQEIVTDKGVKLWLDDCKYPLKNEDGEIVGLFGMSRNITEQVQAKEALRESVKSLGEAQRIAGLGSYDLDIQTGLWTSSDVLDGLLGIDKEYKRTLEGWSALIHPGDCVMMEAYLMDKAAGKGAAFNKEYRIVRQTDHATRWVYELGRLDFDAQDRPLRMRGTIQDITERRQAEEQLRLAASVFTHTREGIMITAADGAILDVNDAFTQITGYGREEVLGSNPRLLKSGRHSKEFYSEMRRALSDNGFWSGEVWNRDKSGRIFAELLTISAVRDAEGKTQQYVALFTDITSIKEHESRLEQIAHFDMLTGLPNRVLLSDRLHQAMVQAHRRNQLVAVAYLDLDGFKAINDRFGHDAGDQLLVHLAKRMKQALREGDTLARLGGDEFVAVCQDLPDMKAIHPELARLLDVVSQPWQTDDHVLQVSASIGVSFYPQAGDVDADQLLRQADQAMYRAKLDGKNRYYIFDDGHDFRVCAHHEDIQSIPQA
jgi:diguanylate cyclase (GGDEF)-like protein/PAS domain S-box-containing protein